MITLNEYKKALIDFYRYQIDSTSEKRKEREFHLKRQFSDETLNKIIHDTYSFAKDVVNSNTVKYNYCSFDIEDDNTFGIFLNISGGGGSDYIYKDSKSRLISDSILRKIFGNSFFIEVKVDEVERECEEDVLSFDYHYRLYMQGFPKNIDEIKEELSKINIENKIILGTGSYSNIKGGNTVSITGDGGNAWGYFGPAYKKLAPKLYLWEYYDKNPDNLSEDDLIDWYIKEYYEVRLRNLDANELLETLNNKFGDNIILLCHEEPGKIMSKKTFCHRRLLADWIELETGIIIPEISTDKNGVFREKETYDLKPKIKKLIK